MKKLKKLELKDVVNYGIVLNEDEQRKTIGGYNSGGYNGCGCPGSIPGGGYTWEQMISMVDDGIWTGGYVEGYGYVAMPATVWGNNSGSISVDQSNDYTAREFLEDVKTVFWHLGGPAAEAVDFTWGVLYEACLKELIEQGSLKLQEIENGMKNGSFWASYYGY